MTNMRDIDEQVNAAIHGMTERMSVESGEAGEAGEDKEEIRPIIAAAPDMLEALVEVKNELDAYIPTCPLCGGSVASGHKYNCLWHVVNAAIRKARG